MHEKPRRKCWDGVDLILYYQEHYPNVSRGKLAQIDQALYKKMRNEEVLHRVPLYDPTPLLRERLEKSFAGKTSTQIRQEDPAFWQAMYRAGILNKCTPGKTGRASATIPAHAGTPSAGREIHRDARH